MAPQRANSSPRKPDAPPGWYFHAEALVSQRIMTIRKMMTRLMPVEMAIMVIG